MKKIYAILVAALMSVSLFAAPTKADLQSYMEEGYYVACFQAPVGSTCNDIYWMGTYVGWNISTDLEDLVKCEELTGANAGWYVAKVPVVEGQGNNGKPIQLNECGKLTWDVQPGTTVKAALVDGSVTIKENGDEYDLEGWSATEPTIITLGAWKKDYNPCERECAQQSYTIRIYPPYCEALDYLEPTIKGTFNNWTDAMTMTFKGSYFELITEPTLDNFEFKFNNDPNGSWDYEFQAYDSVSGSWHGIPEKGNLSLTNGTEYYTLQGTVLTFDFSDDTKYRYAKCGLTYFDVTINAILPAGAPAAGVELMGNFVNGVWDGEGLLMENDAATGAYKATIKATEADEFKFRELGNWDNQIEVSEDGGATWNVSGNFKVGEEMEEDEGNMVINLDLSDPTEYKWSAAPAEEPEYTVLYANLPAANSPEAVNIVVEGEAPAMEHLDNGWWLVKFDVKASQAFTFSSADGSIVIEKYNAEDNAWAPLANELVFGELWQDGTDKGTPCKDIELYLNDAELYRWAAAPEGIENIVLTGKAQKVVVDGAVYIIRDNKMYNIHGAQVR
jgi:hypothetical protein